MFRPSHIIYQFADDHDELDDYLPYAEHLVDKWSASPSPVDFESAFEIQIACLLAEDSLLPQAAVIGLGRALMGAISEARDKHLQIEALKLKPPPAGRKRDNSKILYFRSVKDLLEQGITKTEAYAIVADRYAKSPDTIRRVVERAEKSIRSGEATREKQQPQHGEFTE